MLFVTMFGKADALGDLTTTNAVTETFAGAGNRCGLRGGYGCRRGAASQPEPSNQMSQTFS